MREVQFLILAVIGIFILQHGSFAQSRASFGDKCDRSTRCDSRASLNCVNGTCFCVKENEMTYDLTREKCVVLSGERCSYTAIEILMDTTKEKRWTEKLDCVSNATCKEDGYCGCKPEFYEDSKGFCVSKRSFGENCAKDDECRSDKHLTCRGGLCSCDDTESVFDAGYGQCLAKVGSSCIKYGLCARNAYCARQRGYGSSRDREICQCSSDYRKSKEGLCLGNYGVYCDALSSPCSDDLKCLNGMCQCHYPQHQEFNRTLGECITAVRGPCSEGRMEYRCDENAECRKDLEEGIAQCMCKGGFIESDQRKCRLAYGTPCNHKDICDKVADLQCENGRCKCKDLQEYDEGRKKCLGLVGAVCTSKQFCVDGALCDAYRDENMKMGFCKCKIGYEVEKQRKCRKIEVEMSIEEGTTEVMSADVAVDEY